MTEDPQQPPTRLSVAISPEVEVGVHADLVAVWHDQATFVLDFATYIRPATPGQDQDGNQHVLGQLAFQYAWERETGQRPNPPLDPTDS
jgi:hypothetical protein